MDGNKEEDESIHEAARKGDAATVARLLRKDGTWVHSWEDRDTPLHLAATVEVARVLVEYGADINASDDREWSPLHKAAANSNLSVASFLIEQGAEVDGAFDIEEAPLNFAGSAAMAQLLIDHGASLEGKRPDSLTPLMRAYEDVTKLLLRLGANINSYVPRVGTALTHALSCGNTGKAAMLIEAGADVNLAEDRYGNAPLHLIMLRGNPYWTGLIADWQARTPTRFIPSPVQIMRMLLSRGADLCAHNYSDETPFHVARRLTATNLIKVLKPYMALLDDPFPPLPGPPHAERIVMHPVRQEAVTTVRYGGLARWALDGEPRLLERVQTALPQLLHLAVSPGGEEIAIVTANIVEIRRWNDFVLLSQIILKAPRSQEEMQYLYTLEDAMPVNALAFAPNGRWLAVSVYGGCINLIDLMIDPLERKPDSPITKLRGARAHNWLAFDASSRLLACGNPSEAERVGVYCLAESAATTKRLWTDAEKRAKKEITEEKPEEDKRWYWSSLIHVAISPDSCWIVCFSAGEYLPQDRLGELALYDLQTGRLQWYVSIDDKTVGTDRFHWRNFFRWKNHAEVLFISETELVCGATQGVLLFYNVKTGTLNRRFCFDTEADILSLALDRVSSTLWVVLSDGKLAALPVAD